MWHGHYSSLLATANSFIYTSSGRRSTTVTQKQIYTGTLISNGVGITAMWYDAMRTEMNQVEELNCRATESYGSSLSTAASVNWKIYL